MVFSTTRSSRGAPQCAQSVAQALRDRAIKGGVMSIGGGAEGNDGTREFAADPTHFATCNTLSTEHLNKPGRLPAEGHARLVEVGPQSYEVEYIDLARPVLESHARDAGPFSVPAYFLGYNGPNPANAMPAWVDIPKRAAQGYFLFTGALSGCSVIVTHLDPTTYRVFHDGRTNSSLLYDQVAMAVDYKDYRIPGSILALAVVYLQYVEGEWQLVLQRHDFERGGPAGIRLKRRGAAQALSIYRANVQTLERNQIEFAIYRKQVHQRLKKAASQFGVSVAGVADGVYKDGGFSYEHPAIAAWIGLRKALEAEVVNDIDKLVADKKPLAKLPNSALKHEKTRQLDLAHEYYKTQFHTLLKEVRDVEHLWLWQQIKASQGTAAVLQLETRSSRHRVTVPSPSLAERYEFCEATLRASRNAEFIQGQLDFREIKIPGVGAGMSAVDMKKLFLDGQFTPREQGALSALIAQTSENEYLQKVLSRVALYSEDFRRAGSTFQYLVSQDFFLLRVGDQSGGRCYPLVRAMAVALACGGRPGVERLVEKLQLATADPQARNAVLLKDSLVALHANVHAVQASIATGQFTLDEVVSRLQKTTSTRMFAVNTRWHAMLLGRVVTDTAAGYYFYDPNLGIFAFDSAAALAEGMQHYLLTRGLAAYYGAFGSRAVPAFNLIEMATKEMAEVPVGLGLQVADLSRAEALDSLSEVRWQVEHTVQAQVRIAEDLQLHATLATLDAERWGARFSQASSALANSANLDERWVLVIDTLEDQGEGHFRLQFINRTQPGKTRWVETADATFSQYRDFVDQHLQTLDRHFTLAHEPFRPLRRMTEATPIDGLNAGFTVQALIQWFADQHRQATPRAISSPELATLLKLHGYVNSTQMAHATVQDASRIIEQIKTALHNEEVIAGRFVSALGRVLDEYAGVLFGEVMVGLDAYELAYAESATQKAVFGTQLAFDTASWVTGSAGVVAGLMEASALATMLAGGGVLLGGLGVGFTALARAFGSVAEDAQAVGRYFEMVDSAYKNHGYRYDAGEDALVPLAGAVVQCLDLRSGQIALASQYIYSTEYTWVGDLPQIDLDRGHAIEVRSGIGYGVSRQPLAHSNARLVILPGTPTSYIAHDYGLLPFATERQDAGFDVIRRLQSERFSFAFYVFPGEQIIRRIRHEYVATDIAVVLDENHRQLLVPTLPQALYGYLTYTVTGAGGVCQIELNQGAHIRLEASVASNWLFTTRQLQSDDIRFMEPLLASGGDLLYQRLMIGGVRVEIAPAQLNDIRVVRHNQEQHKVDCATSTTRVERVDASQWPAPGQSIEQHLRDLAQAHRLQGQFVLVENYRHQQRNVGRAFYDVGRNRMLFTDTAGEWATQAHLGAVTEEHAYFYNVEQAIAWRVMIATGEVEGQFNPFRGAHESQSIRLWQLGETVYLGHRHPARGKPQSESIYQIHGARMELVRTTANAVLLRALWQSSTLNLLPCLKPGTPAHTLGRLIEPTPADLLMVHGTDADGVDHRYWIRTPDDLVIKPNLEPPSPQSPQVATGAQTHSTWPIPEDLVLSGTLFLAEGGEVFFFYSQAQKVLFRQKRPGPASVDDERPTATRVATPTLANVLNVSGHLLAITEDGRVARLNALGQLSYEAVNSQWLEGREHWWSDLADVAGSHATLAVFGVKGADGERALPVWYHHGRVVVASASLQDQTLQFLGFEADELTARLFAPASGKLYLQRSMTADELAVVFAAPSRLALAAPVPAAIESLPAQRFKAAERVNAGVRLITLNGEILLRTDNAALQLVAVDAAWQQDLQTYNSWWQWLAFDAEAAVKNAYQLPQALAALARQWRAKGTLTLLGDDAQAWFDIDSGQLFSSRGLRAAAGLRFLGVAVGQPGAYVYCPTKQALYRITQHAPQWLGELTDVKRFGACLLLQTRHSEINPILLAGVDTLILCGHAEINFYALGKPVWAHYRTVIIDHDDQVSAMSRIQLSMTDSAAILLSRSADDLLLSDALTGAALLVRRAFKQRTDNLLIELSDVTTVVRVANLVRHFLQASHRAATLLDVSSLNQQ